MKAFGIFLFVTFACCVGIYAVGKNVHYKPWVKTGQEKEYAEAMEAIRILHNAETDSDSAQPLLPPQFFCEQTEYDFGIMQVGQSASMQFKIENKGSGPLAISDEGTSCGCVSNDFGVLSIPPGENKLITLTWEPFARGKFEKSQTIKTNDPELPEVQFIIRGNILTTLAASPVSVAFDRLIAGTNSSDKYIEVFSEAWEEFSIDRVETTSDLVACKVGNSLSYDAKNDKSFFRLAVSAVAPEGKTNEIVRVFVRPPADVKPTSGPEQISDGLAWQPDGTVLIEVPVSMSVINKMSLYSPLLRYPQGAELLGSSRPLSKAKIELGKLFSRDAADCEWFLVGKFRGDQRPTSIDVEVDGIPNLVAEVVLPQADTIGDSFKVRIFAKSRIPVGLYDRAQGGLLKLKAPGLDGEELMELPVLLDVLANSERAETIKLK